MRPQDILPPEEQRLLLRLARSAIRSAVEAGRVLPAVPALPELLRRRRGVFVTLRLEGDLRGCIGYPFPVKPLAEATQEAAVSAALRDPRFPPVEVEELPRISLEISVLTEPAPIAPQDVQVGVHGLIVRCGGKSGLLLPQVAMEYGWDAEEFLAQTCRKAGLPHDAWKKGEVLGFEAQVFGEEDFPAGSGGDSVR